MRTRWHIALVLAFAATVPSPTMADADPARVAILTRSLLSDDSNERITAVVELEKLGADAEPALPTMRAALKRERDAGIKVLMMRAIASIEAAPREPMQPTDIAGHADRVHALLEKLASTTDAKAARAELDALGIVARRVVVTHDSGTRLTLDDCRVIITKAMWEAAGQLAAQDAKLRIRAIRGIAEFGAAAGPALDALGRLAISDDDPAVRKLAGRAVAKIEKHVEITRTIRAEQ